MSDELALEDKKEQLAQARQSWLEHEYTREAAKVFDKWLTDAQANFRTACATTTDPKVAKAYAAVIELQRALRLYKTGGEL